MLKQSEIKDPRGCVYSGKGPDDKPSDGHERNVMAMRWTASSCLSVNNIVHGLSTLLDYHFEDSLTTIAPWSQIPKMSMYRKYKKGFNAEDYSNMPSHFPKYVHA